MRFNDWAADSVRLHVAGCRPAVKVYLAQEHFAAGTQKHLAAIWCCAGPRPTLSCFAGDMCHRCMQYSCNSSLGAICGRGDVNAAHPVAYGCYDTKVANFAMAAQRWAAGVVGPTTGQVRC